MFTIFASQIKFLISRPLSPLARTRRYAAPLIQFHAGQTAPDPRNRATRRQAARFARLARGFSPRIRRVAALALGAFVYSTIILPLLPAITSGALFAQPNFREFDDSKQNMERYRERANRRAIIAGE